MKLRRQSLSMASAAALVLIGSAAYAGPPWTVSVGGSSAGGPADYTASTIGDGPDIAVTVPKADFTCEAGTTLGSIAPGSTAAAIGRIAGSTFTDCFGPFGIELPIRQTSVWDINITGDNVGGATPASIGNITAHVENPDGLCEFDITGSVPATFDENTQQLHVDGGGLTISNVSGCFGAFGNGNPMTFEATFQLADVAPVTITN
ncbi:hypothetical protein [Aeromicrobium sp. CF3.5]|uniref:hypothetical protein n=1 Tax=Aeromicrobium sp. CF3.5 TaxID=3373078 RepID=UPI003EE65C69